MPILLPRIRQTLADSPVSAGTATRLCDPKLLALHPAALARPTASSPTSQTFGWNTHGGPLATFTVGQVAPGSCPQRYNA